MATVAIPAWNANGVIPPISSANPTSAERSPYVVSLSEFVLRFATSAKRRQILNGFLQYRARLHTAGLTTGFQWLDGSFMENIEATETRDPNDMDVVTFFKLPVGLTQAQVAATAPDLLDRRHLKATYFVDAFFVYLGSQAVSLVERSAYWYSVWSHRRDSTWKGYLQVDLDPVNDALAVLQLRAGGTP
jgi:hypothetical protein